jgi:dipeptidyl aminopeptidase/acylaminoacyl peptidase
MIENEDTPTIPRPTAPKEPDNAATIQVPPVPQVPSESSDQDDTAVIAKPVHEPVQPEQDNPSALSEQATEATRPEQTNVAVPSEPTATIVPTEEQAEATLPIEEANVPPSAAPVAPAAPIRTANPVAPTVPYATVEDLLSLHIVGDPQISPDGSLIAFSVLQSDGEKNTTSSALWLVSSSGGKTQAAWQITGGEHRDTTPRWSPDGRTLAFLSDRTGTTQIYLLPMGGGEARQFSTLPHGVTEYRWRPDGLVLLAHSAWGPADQHSGPDRSNEVQIFTRLDAHWDGQGYKQGRYQQLWLLPLDGPAIRLTSEPVDLEQSCWSPDGYEIVFCANRRSDPDLSASRALWVLTVATGQMRRLTPEDGLAQVPSWSPDGQSIAYLYTGDQTEAGNMSPWLVRADGSGTAQPSVQGAEHITCQMWVIDELRSEYLPQIQWYPSGKSLLVPVQERGQVHLYRIDLESYQLTRLTSGNGRYLAPQLSKNGQMIALVRADWFTPGDIWSMDSTGKNPRKLTGVNDAFLRSHQWIRPRRITWKSFDGLEIEGWLYLPPLPENVKAPLILAPHGGPSLAWGDAYSHEFQVLAGRGYAVLAPNPRGSAGYGEAFAREVVNDWGGGDFHDVMAGIDHLIATEPVDETRLGIGGLSYGGYMTNRAITQTARFKAAVSRNGISSIATAALLSDQTVWLHLSMHDPEMQLQRSALTHVDQIATPLLLLHAENDLRCPFSESMQLFVALRRLKRTVELVCYRHVSHLMDWPEVGTPQQRIDRLRRTIQWFEHFV